jgi:DNA-binding CsgD family transcriptional regulator
MSDCVTPDYPLTAERPPVSAPPKPTPDDASVETIPVVWYNDAKAAAVEQKDAPRLGVAATLANARSDAERARIVAGLLHLTGFSTFTYFALEFTGDRVQRLFLHEAFTPSTYRGEYVRRHHFNVDPRTFGARMYNVPVVWDLRNLRRESERPEATFVRDGDNGARETLEDFLQTMRDDGMCSGIMAPIAMPGRRLHAFMSFTAPRRSRDWITSSTVELALTIGLSVHKVGSPKLITTAREHTVNGLSAFELRLLTCVAEGASDKEIGRRLDTTPHNIDYHLRKLRKRFGVSNRIELTYLLSKLELI